MRISLTEWAARHYSPQTMPSLATLRVWAKAGLITDCKIICNRWTASHDSVHIEQQPAHIQAGVSSRVAGILRAA